MAPIRTPQGLRVPALLVCAALLCLCLAPPAGAQLAPAPAPAPAPASKNAPVPAGKPASPGPAPAPGPAKAPHPTDGPTPAPSPTSTLGTATPSPAAVGTGDLVIPPSPGMDPMAPPGPVVFSDDGLSGGQVAGIVVGVFAGRGPHCRRRVGAPRALPELLKEQLQQLWGLNQHVAPSPSHPNPPVAPPPSAQPPAPLARLLCS